MRTTLAAETRPVIFKGESELDTRTLVEYAEFWKIPHNPLPTNEEATVFTTKTRIDQGSTGPVIITPTGGKGAESLATYLGLSTRSRNVLLSLPVQEGTAVSIRTDIQEFRGSQIETILQSGEDQILSRIKGTRIHILSVDLVGEYTKRVYGGMEENPDWKFRLATKLPSSYQLIPRSIRERTFRSEQGISEIRDENLGPVEFLRTIFLASIIISSGPTFRIRFWRRGKSYALAVTHDVESAYGLTTGSRNLLRVERSLGISSTWNLPSHRYPLDRDSAAQLGESGEIGGHDTMHDGRLVLVGRSKKVQRLRDCRNELESLTGHKIRGFRAPLLQHSRDLTDAEVEAGYEYDSSCPSWEIRSPTSLKPHGVGTVFPFSCNGILEIPVSLPQDHQLIRVGGQQPSEAVDTLHRVSKWIQGLGGACVLLVHPDYEFAEDQNETIYRRLLESFASDPRCEIMTLGQVADWWNHRAKARWDTTASSPRLVTADTDDAPDDLEMELVTGYGISGFTTERLG